MLRSKKFRPFEKTMLFAMAFFLIAAGLIGGFSRFGNPNGDLGLPAFVFWPSPQFTFALPHVGNRCDMDELRPAVRRS